MGRTAAWSIAAVLVMGGSAAWAQDPPAKPSQDAPAKTGAEDARAKDGEDPYAGDSQSASVPPEAAAPRLHHSPITTASPHQPLEVSATIDHPHLIKHAGVAYRSDKGATVRTVPFQRAASGGYVAVIPATDVQSPALAYTIEIERVDGTRGPVFASRQEMQPVQVLEDRADSRERRLFDRLDGRRSVVTVSSDVVRFGKTRSNQIIPCAEGGEGCQPGDMVRPEIEDQYWRVEAVYTYRLLRTVAEFSIRGGVVRGTSLVALEEYDESKYDVGLNYGAPSVRFRLADAWHLETELLASVTEVGFSVGTGGALLIGDPYGSRLTLGFQTIGLSESTYFGSRFYSRMDLAAGERFTVAPIVEVTDMPHAEAFGVRLLAEVGASLGGGFSAALRGGYQARKSTSGGLALGGNVGLAF